MMPWCFPSLRPKMELMTISAVTTSYSSWREVYARLHLDRAFSRKMLMRFDSVYSRKRHRDRLTSQSLDGTRIPRAVLALLPLMVTLSIRGAPFLFSLSCLRKKRILKVDLDFIQRNY